MKVDVLLGLQWGDEGKGKVVDVLTHHATMWLLVFKVAQTQVIPSCLKARNSCSAQFLLEFSKTDN